MSDLVDNEYSYHEIDRLFNFIPRKGMHALLLCHRHRDTQSDVSM